MKLATLNSGDDGRLVVVSRDLLHMAPAAGVTTLQDALDRWGVVSASLQAQYDRLNAGEGDGIRPVDAAQLGAIMPRSYQFLDASAFLAHSDILAKAWGFEPRSPEMPPLMYQGLSNHFHSPHGDVPFADYSMEVDFEAELGVITDAVPLGITPAAALDHIKLVIMINDWSLRQFGAIEMRGGFGFIHAKPPSTLSAFAVTPDELGAAWQDGRIHLPLEIRRGDALFGFPNGREMNFGFHDLVAHAAKTRDLCAGTIIGSGTVANAGATEVGSGCIAERRALERLAQREATPYLQPGEVVEISLQSDDGKPLLGRISQQVVAR